MPLRSALPSSEVRCWMTARRSLVSSSGRPLLVGPVEDQPEGGLLGVVEVEHLRQQDRAELGERGPDRDGRARRRPATGTRPGTPVGAQSSPVSLARDWILGLASPGLAMPGQVALDVGQQHRHAGVRQLLGEPLQRLGLAGTGGARRPGRAG